MGNWDAIGRDFQRYILRWEGGYVNHPDDPGGHTNKGVTLATFQNLAPALLGIPGTLDNLKKLTDAQHLKILKYYWDSVKGDSFSNPVIAAYATELAWGSGPGNSKKMFRTAGNAIGVQLSSGSSFTADDIKKINALGPVDLFNAITTARINFY